MIETSGHGAMAENHFLDDGAYLAVKVRIVFFFVREEDCARLRARPLAAAAETGFPANPNPRTCHPASAARLPLLPAWRDRRERPPLGAAPRARLFGARRRCRKGTPRENL